GSSSAPGCPTPRTPRPAAPPSSTSTPSPITAARPWPAPSWRGCWAVAGPRGSAPSPSTPATMGARSTNRWGSGPPRRCGWTSRADRRSGRLERFQQVSRAVGADAVELEAHQPLHLLRVVHDPGGHFHARFPRAIAEVVGEEALLGHDQLRADL